MATPLSGNRIRKELGRFLPSHRLVISEPSHNVTVRPESVPEVCSVLQYAQTESVPVFPMPEHGEIPVLEDWSIVLSLSGLKSVLDYSPDSSLVTVQAGATFDAFGDWLHDKHLALATAPETEGPIALWEYLLSPEVGRFGPRFGAKWDQVLSLSAILPNGRPFRMTASPGRSVGPDFSRLILMGRGRFGLPLELTLRVHPKPSRRETMVFLMPDLPTALEAAWRVAEEAAPEFLEAGMRRTKSASQAWLSVELWGEGNRLSVSKERVRKRIGSAASSVENTAAASIPASTLGPNAIHGNLPKHEILKELAPALEAVQYDMDVRIRGFLDGHACVIVRGEDVRMKACPESSIMHSSPDGERMLMAMAKELDPAGVFARVPSLWE